MGAVFFTILISYLITSFFGYVVHWSLHQSWTGFLNKAHMTHHLKMYPPEDYLSDTYRHAGKDSTPKFFIIAALPVILAPIILGVLGVLSISTVIIILLTQAVMGFLHDYIHDALHIKNHLLTRIPVVKVIFDKWVRLHYLHHVDMEKNYGIFVFHWDHVFRSFWKID